MNKTLLECDREYVKEKVNVLVDRFFDDMKVVNNTLHEQEKLIKKLEFSNTMLARGYAIKLGILLTQKQWEKKQLKQKIKESIQ